MCPKLDELYRYRAFSDKIIFERTSKKKILMGNVKLSSFLDPLLYFYLKQLFYNISFAKKHECILPGKLGNTVETSELFITLVLMKKL